MSTDRDYRTIPQVDLALIRARARRMRYFLRGETTSVNGQTHVIDRLLDRRLELMAARDEAVS